MAKSQSKKKTNSEDVVKTTVPKKTTPKASSFKEIQDILPVVREKIKMAYRTTSMQSPKMRVNTKAKYEACDTLINSVVDKLKKNQASASDLKVLTTMLEEATMNLLFQTGFADAIAKYNKAYPENSLGKGAVRTRLLTLKTEQFKMLESFTAIRESYSVTYDDIKAVDVLTDALTVRVADVNKHLNYVQRQVDRSYGPDPSSNPQLKPGDHAYDDDSVESFIDDGSNDETRMEDDANDAKNMVDETLSSALLVDMLPVVKQALGISSESDDGFRGSARNELFLSLARGTVFAQTWFPKEDTDIGKLRGFVVGVGLEPLLVNQSLLDSHDSAVYDSRGVYSARLDLAKVYSLLSLPSISEYSSENLGRVRILEDKAKKFVEDNDLEDINTPQVLTSTYLNDLGVNPVIVNRIYQTLAVAFLSKNFRALQGVRLESTDKAGTPISLFSALVTKSPQVMPGNESGSLPFSSADSSIFRNTVAFPALKSTAMRAFEAVHANRIQLADMLLHHWVYKLKSRQAIDTFSKVDPGYSFKEVRVNFLGVNIAADEIANSLLTTDSKLNSAPRQFFDKRAADESLISVTVTRGLVIINVNCLQLPTTTKGCPDVANLLYELDRRLTSKGQGSASGDPSLSALIVQQTMTQNSSSIADLDEINDQVDLRTPIVLTPGCASFSWNLNRRALYFSESMSSESDFAARDRSLKQKNYIMPFTRAGLGRLASDLISSTTFNSVDRILSHANDPASLKAVTNRNEEFLVMGPHLALAPFSMISSFSWIDLLFIASTEEFVSVVEEARVRGTRYLSTTEVQGLLLSFYSDATNASGWRKGQDNVDVVKSVEHVTNI